MYQTMYTYLSSVTVIKPITQYSKTLNVADLSLYVSCILAHFKVAQDL